MGWGRCVVVARAICTTVLVIFAIQVLPVYADQAVSTRTGSDLPATPQAISGIASSAQHCISADAANVHGLGWVDASTGYTVTFDSDIPLATAVIRLNLTERTQTISYGTGDLSRTASSSGTMALYVAGNGRAGCYRYKTVVQPPAAVATSAASTSVISPAAITGMPSSAQHCISGNAVANVHEIGRVENGNRFTITMATNFDAVLGASLVNAAGQQAASWTDDNSGGGVEPQLSITAPHAGSLALYVAGVNGAAGCYRYQVEIR